MDPKLKLALDLLWYWLPREKGSQFWPKEETLQGWFAAALVESGYASHPTQVLQELHFGEAGAPAGSVVKGFWRGEMEEVADAGKGCWQFDLTVISDPKAGAHSVGGYEPASLPSMCSSGDDDRGTRPRMTRPCYLPARSWSPVALLSLFLVVGFGSAPAEASDKGLGNGLACKYGSECASGNCSSHLCKPRSGGGKEFANGVPCKYGSECASGNCVSHTCKPRNGGAKEFANGVYCKYSSECASGSCVSHLCAPRSGSQLANGVYCRSGSECATGNCVANLCTPRSGGAKQLGNGITCQSGSECASGNCVSNVCKARSSTGKQLGNGVACRSGSECASGNCVSNVCKAR